LNFRLRLLVRAAAAPTLRAVDPDSGGIWIQQHPFHL